MKITFLNGNPRNLFAWEKETKNEKINSLELKIKRLILENKDIEKENEDFITNPLSLRDSRKKNLIFKETLGEPDFFSNGKRQYKGIYAYNAFNPETSKFTTYFAYKGMCSCPCSDKNLLKIEWDKEWDLIELDQKLLEKEDWKFNYRKFFNTNLSNIR